MNYINYLYNLNPNKIKLGLERTFKLLAACDNPHNKLEIIQIVGTNGKGSVTAMLNHVFSSNGYRTGMFTSPHLVIMNERIRVNYNTIQDSDIVEFISTHKKNIDDIGASFFEVITVMALWYFKKHKVDIVFLETGLGGIFDSTTACKAKGLLVTSISKDHEHILGKTIKKIIKNKLGAITRHTEFIISGNQNPYKKKIMNDEAKFKNQKIICVDKPPIDFSNNIFQHLKGKFQYENGALAYYAAKHIAKQLQLKVNNEVLLDCILSTYWPGRMQILQSCPTIIYDVCHNQAGVQQCIEYITTQNAKYRKTYLLLAFEQTKNIDQKLKDLISYFDKTVITETNIKNSRNANELMQYLNLPQVFVERKIDKALNDNIKSLNNRDMLLIIGSHYIGPYINKIFKNCFGKKP